MMRTAAPYDGSSLLEALRIDERAPRMRDLPPDEHREMADRALGGRVSTVYHAQLVVLGRRLAVRVVRAPDLHHRQRRAAIDRAVRLAVRLRHESLVSVHSAQWLDDGALALLQQWMAGGPLRETLQRRGPLPPGQAVGLLRSASRALDAAWASARVLHASPSLVLGTMASDHLFLERPGHVVLDAHDALLGIGTGSGVHLPPEVDSGEVTPRSGVFALGCLGWELIAGRQPNAEPEDPTLPARHGRGGEPWRALPEHVPPAFADALHVAMEREPSRRWSSADDLLGALQTAATESRRRATRPWEQRAEAPPVASVRTFRAASGPASPSASTMATEPQVAAARPVSLPSVVAALAVVGALIVAGALWGRTSGLGRADAAPLPQPASAVEPAAPSIMADDRSEEGSRTARGSRVGNGLRKVVTWLRVTAGGATTGPSGLSLPGQVLDTSPTLLPRPTVMHGAWHVRDAASTRGEALTLALFPNGAASLAERRRLPQRNGAPPGTTAERRGVWKVRYWLGGGEELCITWTVPSPATECALFLVDSLRSGRQLTYGGRLWQWASPDHPVSGVRRSVGRGADR